jgi:hypothetical protein
LLGGKARVIAAPGGPAPPGSDSAAHAPFKRSVADYAERIIYLAALIVLAASIGFGMRAARRRTGARPS